MRGLQGWGSRGHELCGRVVMVFTLPEQILSSSAARIKSGSSRENTPWIPPGLLPHPVGKISGPVLPQTTPTHEATQGTLGPAMVVFGFWSQDDAHPSHAHCAQAGLYARRAESSAEVCMKGTTEISSQQDTSGASNSFI